MKVIHFVSKEDNVICIIQVSEVVVAQWKTSSMIQSIARQNTAEREHSPVWH